MTWRRGRKTTEHPDPRAGGFLLAASAPPSSSPLQGAHLTAVSRGWLLCAVSTHTQMTHHHSNCAGHPTSATCTCPHAGSQVSSPANLCHHQLPLPLHAMGSSSSEPDFTPLRFLTSSLCSFHAIVHHVAQGIRRESLPNPTASA